MGNIKSKEKKIHIEYGDYGILFALIGFWIILAITNADFRGLGFYQNILTRASLNAICGVGMTFAIISSDLDLSVASQVAVNGVVITLLLPVTGMIPAILLVLLLGAVMGLLNGLLIAKLKIPAFIATLGTQMAYRAAAQLINSQPVVVADSTFKKLATLKLAGILPLAFVIMAVLAVIGTVILRKTRLGRNILAVGNSKEAAKIAGINVDYTQIMIYVLVGIFTACASVMIVSNLGSSNYGMQTGLEFTVISAVVLGGTALSGGKGSIFTTVVAAVFLVTIRSAMDSFGVDSYWQKVVEGIILVIAFSITQIRSMIATAVVKRKTRKAMLSR